MRDLKPLPQFLKFKIFRNIIMPYRRRYKRKRYRRYRRRYGKKMKLPKSISTGYLYCKQKATEDIIVPIQTPGTIHAQFKTFQLSDMTQNWGAVFDQFRIVGCKTQFWATSNLPGVSTNPIMLYTSIDLDGVPTLPATENDMLQRSNVKQRQLTFGGSNPQYHSHYVRPRTAQAIYNSAIATAYGMGPRNQWLDIRSSVNAPHYGLLHAYVAPSGNGSPIPIRIQTTYYLQFRKVI